MCAHVKRDRTYRVLEEGLKGLDVMVECIQQLNARTISLIHASF